MSLLDEDPTAIRKFFRLQELWERSQESPTAAVGMIDLVESLAPAADMALDQKRKVIANAIRTVQGADGEESIRCLLLINDRFDREAFRQVGVEESSMLASAVSKLTEQSPESTLRHVDALAGSDENKSDSPFFRGLLDGLGRLALHSPASLGVLRHFSESAPTLITRVPSLAASYLQGIRGHSYEAEGRQHLTGWLAAVANRGIRGEIRRSLLPDLRSDDNAPIAAELLQELSPEDVQGAPEPLAIATRGFSTPGLRRAIENVLCPAHPDIVREWASRTSLWSMGVAALVAASFSPNEQGMRAIVAAGFSAEKKAQVMSMFLHRIAEDRYPPWFVEFTQHDPEVLIQLLIGGVPNLPEVALEINRVLHDIRPIPIVRASQLQDLIGDFSGSVFFESLVDTTMRSIIDAYVDGQLSDQDCQRWQQADWTGHWLGHVDGRLVSTLLTQRRHYDVDKWVRAWRWYASTHRPCICVAGSL